MKNNSILLFRVILEVSSYKAKSKSYRDIAIQTNQSLSTLAKAIVTAFGFDFDHCYGFYDNLKDIYKSQELYELFTDIGEDPTPGAGGVERTKAGQVFTNIGKTMKFLFDYYNGPRNLDSMVRSKNYGSNNTSTTPTSL